ncbi:MAG: DUF2235 domain-containing protein [Xanthomonadaceae bacterium]|nr:DUF2235 domain-containing protein [Xanthomonadaceae bacterium]
MGQVGKGHVDMEPATQQDLDSYRLARAELDQMRIPVLLPDDDPHARLYVAALDGTGNSMLNDSPEKWSAVAKIASQVEVLRSSGVKNIGGGYVEGTFTQEGLLRAPSRLLDGVFAHSFDERVETAYYQFCLQSREWLIEDPQAQIRVAGVGFSRGSEEVTALQRLINERGIRDPEGAQVKLDQDNLIQKVKYADRPLLVPPGKTLQAALLLDPVATGVKDEERVLPSSNLSTFEISAQHEIRDQYKNNEHVPQGFSQDGRDLNVTVPGAHSDIGNAYEKNGLGVLSFNLGVEYLNRLSDTPYLKRQVEPTDPSQYVIHRSDQHMMGLYTTRGYDKDGVRDTVEDQSPRPGVQRREPIDPNLAAQVEWRSGPATTVQKVDVPASKENINQVSPIGAPNTRVDRSETDIWLDRAFTSYMGSDPRAFSDTMTAYRASAQGMEWTKEQQGFSAKLREQERADELQQQAMMAEQQQVQQRATAIHR